MKIQNKERPVHPFPGALWPCIFKNQNDYWQKYQEREKEREEKEKRERNTIIKNMSRFF